MTHRWWGQFDDKFSVKIFHLKLLKLKDPLNDSLEYNFFFDTFLKKQTFFLGEINKSTSLRYNKSTNSWPLQMTYKICVYFTWTIAYGP